LVFHEALDLGGLAPQAPRRRRPSSWRGGLVDERGGQGPEPTLASLAGADSGAVWLAFLEHKFGVQSFVRSAPPSALASAGAISGWELAVIRDPDFEKFLRYGPGRTGIGPKTVADFLALPEDRKRFFVDVFRQWKKIIKEKGIDLSKLP